MMAFSAARIAPTAILNLNERAIGSGVAGGQLASPAKTVMCPSVHALLPRQLRGRKLQVQSMPSTSQRVVQVPRASNGHGSIRRSQPGDAVPGNSKLQEELLDVLRLEIAKAQMSMFCDEEADKLREIAAEGLRELDRKFQNTILNTCNEVDAEGERVSCRHLRLEVLQLEEMLHAESTLVGYSPFIGVLSKLTNQLGFTRSRCTSFGERVFLSQYSREDQGSATYLTRKDVFAYVHS